MTEERQQQICESCSEYDWCKSDIDNCVWKKENESES